MYEPVQSWCSCDGANLNFSVCRGGNLQQSVSEEGLQLAGAAGGGDHVHHLHTRRPRPTTLHALLPGISFVAQHIPGGEKKVLLLVLLIKTDANRAQTTASPLPQQWILNDVQLALEPLQLLAQLQSLHHGHVVQL